MDNSRLIFMAYGNTKVGLFNLTLTEESDFYQVMVKKNFASSVSRFMTEVTDFTNLDEAIKFFTKKRA